MWQATIASVKHSNRWCPECWKDKIRLTLEEVQEEATKRGGKLLTTTYINCSTKMLWMCESGHKWETTASSVRNEGSWCPYCRYKSEDACRKIIEDIFSYRSDCSFPKSTPRFLRIKETKRGLELDGYNEELRLAFEYQGRQHYEYIPFFHRHGPEDLEKQQQRDQIKRERCVEEGVDLIEIPFIYTYENSQEMRSFIEDQILEFETRRTVLITLPE